MVLQWRHCTTQPICWASMQRQKSIQAPHRYILAAAFCCNEPSVANRFSCPVLQQGSHCGYSLNTMIGRGLIAARWELLAIACIFAAELKEACQVKIGTWPEQLLDAVMHLQTLQHFFRDRGVLLQLKMSVWTGYDNLVFSTICTSA